MTQRVVNTYQVGYPDLDNKGVSFLTVLTQDLHGKYKAYSALVTLPEPSDASYQEARAQAADRIALRGSPERFDRAKTFFNLTEDQYRK